MLSKLKGYFLDEVLSKDLDTIQVANVTVVFLVVVLSLVLLIPLQIMYLIIGNSTQLIIGLTSVLVFLSALFLIKIKKNINPIAHGIMVFSTIICALNIFMYPKNEFSNALLLCCNIIFASNFFERKTGFVYAFIHFILPIVYLYALEYKMDTSFITPINQPVGEKIATFILLFVIVILLIVHYQTAHKNAAKKLTKVIDDLKTSEDRRKKSQKVGKIGNWEFNIYSNEFIWEDETYEIFGIPKQVKQPFAQMLECLDDNHSKQIVETLGGKEVVKSFNIEPDITTKDGLRKTLAIFGELHYDKEYQPSKYLGIVQDITERKKAEIEQKKLLDITNFQNGKLKNFAYIVSHNIRSHSSNITSLVEFLEKATNEEERTTVLEMLKKTTINLDSTLHNLNTIITITENYSKPKITVNLKTEVQKALDILAGAIYQHKIEVLINIADDHLVDVIPSYCDSILLNIISNAIKYKSPMRKSIIEITSSLTNDYCILSIKDNGIGINMAKYGDKLFGMYNTFHENDDARGIGLFITKNHIEAMKGKIEVESQEDIGSTFKILFYRHDY